MDGQRGEVAGVAGERVRRVVQATVLPGEQETAVRLLADAERHQEVPVPADPLTLEEGQEEVLKVGHAECGVLAAGETDEGVEMLVALEDEAGPQPELVAHGSGEQV